MSDSYQAIYDAVRSKISNGDIGSAIRDVAFHAFDISYVKSLLQQEISAISYEMQRPSVLFRPTLTIDGNMWCALLGENLQDGICAFATSPDEAMRNFDAAFKAHLPPKVSSGSAL